MKIIITTFILLFLLTGVSCSQTSTSSNAVGDNDGKKSQSATNTVPEFEAKKDESYKPWNAKVGDNMFVWDGNDLEIEFANKRKIELFSTYSAEEHKFQIEENDASECSMKFLYRPLAVAGNFVSYEIESGTLCGGVNTIVWGYSTGEILQDGYSDSSRSSEMVRAVYLSDIFSEEDIFKAFIANERIKSDLSKLVVKHKIEGKPMTYAQLKKTFDKFPYDFLDGNFYLQPEALDNFAIHDLPNDNQVCVWLSLLPNSHAGQGLQEHLELVLPIPNKIRAGLLKANSGTEGFLMKDADNTVGNKPATFEFEGK